MMLGLALWSPIFFPVYLLNTRGIAAVKPFLIAVFVAVVGLVMLGIAEIVRTV